VRGVDEVLLEGETVENGITPTDSERGLPVVFWCKAAETVLICSIAVRIAVRLAYLEDGMVVDET